MYADTFGLCQSLLIFNSSTFCESSNTDLIISRFFDYLMIFEMQGLAFLDFYLNGTNVYITLYLIIIISV